ncbi:carbohydrate sulfotransferase 8 [Oryzias latipes]|uniref:Carbohydrate sulfotransferase n=1 Tax=Oryzias latipes TaxID=8090 RepID=A0A3B3HM15_ORYLA|nr:carbohydrate sulfotransferase 8 [Oryzias latipes]
MKMKMVVDALCGRRRRLPCFLLFILLFGAGGLVLFIHQQETSELAQAQAHAMRLASTLRQSRETLSTQDKERHKSYGYQRAQTPEGVLTSLIPPMQFPHTERRKQKAFAMSQEHDMDSLHVTKRQLKLLKTSPLVILNKNSGFSNSSVFAASSSLSVSPLDSSSSSSGSALQGSWKFFSILEARKQLMKEICAKYKGSISKIITRSHVKHLYVEDKHKLLYCQVPKTGCSNWKRTLMVLAGKASNVQNIQHDTVHYGGHLKKLESFSQKEIMHRLETYKKFVFVREPFERIVSAYRDKLENPNDYYHNLFGKPIISKYRLNPSEEALRTGSGVMFKEFIQYLLDVHRPVGMDIHWDQVNQLCHPCLIHYDFIGKFENMGEESNFLLRLIGAPLSLTLPTFKDRNPGDKRTSLEITKKYFSQLSMLERQRLYDFYYMDYLMFNYSKPFKDLY